MTHLLQMQSASESSLAALPAPPSWRASFLAGLRACAPLALSIVPLMTVYGVTARAAGLPFWLAQLLSVAVFAGSQLVAVQLLAAGVPSFIAAFTAALMNLRHVIYSVSLAPAFKQLPWYWRLLAGYLLTDETYTTLSARLKQQREAYPQWFLLGGGSLIWLAAQVGTALGGWLGQTIPASWPLEFAGTLVFLVLLVLSLINWAAVVTACTAGTLSVLLAAWPWRLGVVVAIVAGLVVGWVAQKLTRQPAARAERGA